MKLWEKKKNSDIPEETEKTAIQDVSAEHPDETLEKIVRKKKHKMPKGAKIAIILAVIALIGGGIAYNAVSSANAPVPVTTVTASKGDLEQTISTSGTVNSENEKIYYADATAQIASVNIVKGDTVSAGSMLLTYDTSALELAKKKADLNAAVTDDTMNEQLEADVKNQLDFLEASASKMTLEQQIAAYEAQENNIECQIASLKKWAESDGDTTSINSEISKISSAISELQATANTLSANDASLSSINSQIDAKKKDLKAKQDELSALQDESNSKNVESTKLAEDLRLVQDKLTKLNTDKTTAASKKDTAENGILTDTKRNELATSKELDAVNRQEAADNLAEAKAGVSADFTGIVKDVKATQGMTAAPGTELFTIDDTEHVKVDIQVSKYDLANIREGQKAELTIADKKYNGTVSKVNHIAEKNSSGSTVVTAEIDITNPDSDIYIGVEAKCIIHVANAKKVILLPVETVNADKNGSYCYVIADGIVKRQPVETGIASDIYVEITKGIKEGDQIVADTSAGVTEGMKAVAIPETDTDDTVSDASVSDASSK